MYGGNKFWRQDLKVAAYYLPIKMLQL